MPKTLDAIVGQLGRDRAAEKYRRVWPYIASSMLLSAAVFFVESVHQLAVLSAVNIAFALVAGARAAFLRKTAKMFIVQSVVIIALYQLRFGFSSGIMPGVMVSWKIALAFMPGFIFMSAIPQHRTVEALGRLLPPRTAFIVGATISFLPALASAIREIYEVQALRGAKVMPRDFMRPSGWRDAVVCILIPSIVRAMSLAHEIALAAEAREFGIYDRRTNWPGE